VGLIGVNEVIGKGEAGMIENGRKVSFEYTLTVDGEIVDSSEGHEPFTYTHGEKSIIPGLASQMEGLKEGDERTIIVGPEDAYGVIDEAAFQEVPKTQLPQGVDLEIGTQLQAASPDGNVIVVRVAEVRDASVILDFNHPLAGKTLEFQVKILSIQ